jgi:hypothetical protein
MVRTALSIVSGLLAFSVCWEASAAELSDKTFTEVQKLIKPQKEESLWRHIPWETSLNTARQKAAAEGKPLLIWSGGGSAPLGGC